MTRMADDSRDLRIDYDTVGGGYFKHAVYNHWDPYEDISDELMEQDLERMKEAESTEEEYMEVLQYLALFGAGEEAVTEDLAPLMIAMDDIEDEMFVSSQIYDEAKHAQFFDRYWDEVVYPAADHHGFERVHPTDERFFPDDYVELFDRTEEAMELLLTEDTPENRVKAYCHYHLTVESILAQTGYWGFTSAASPRGSDEVAQADVPHLEALIEGISYIRQDEGRHVGFGMQKVQQHIEEDGVDEAVVRNTLDALLPLVATSVSAGGEAVNPTPLIEYAREKFSRRMDLITDSEAEIPDVETLVSLDDDAAAAD